MSVEHRPIASLSGAVSPDERAAFLGRRGATVWFTGLPGSGKTTLSCAVERALLADGIPAYRLDGDEVRQHLCRDLGFDRESRAENVRRVANVARLLADAGTVVLVALISPYVVDRERARALHTGLAIPFIEVFLDTPVEVCHDRDPKGLYAQADAGDLRRLTGVDDPYEPPADPDVRVQPGPLDRSVESVIAALARSAVLPGRTGRQRQLRN